MQLRSKYYTYPVITEDADFYIDSSFTSNVEQVLDGYNIRLKLKAELVNPELEERLKSEEVMIAHHIECTQTCFRKLVLTNEYNKDCVLRDGEVNGVVQICTFLVANKSIDKYTNSLFAPDFRGFRFDIDRGCILAVGNQINLRINKIRDDLANTSSIFSIVPNRDETITNIKVDTTGNKIVISIPQETFSIYSNIEEESVDEEEVLIDEIGLSVRAVNAFRRAKIYTLNELIEFLAVNSVSDLRNVGAKTVKETEELIEKLRTGELEIIRSKTIDNVVSEGPIFGNISSDLDYLSIDALIELGLSKKLVSNFLQNNIKCCEELRCLSKKDLSNIIGSRCYIWKDSRYSISKSRGIVARG